MLILLLLALSSAQYLQYWHNWADEQGETHFTLCNLTNGWKAAAFAPGQPPIFVNTMANMSTGHAKLTWFFTPYKWNPEVKFHANPVVQFGIWFVGQELFQSSDGTKVYIQPGVVYFGDDVGSKGHHSENVGYGPAISAMIQYSGTSMGKGPCWPSNVESW